VLACCHCSRSLKWASLRNFASTLASRRYFITLLLPTWRKPLSADHRRGADVAFAGGGSSVLAVAGADERGGCVMLLDTLAPPASAAIARINCSHARARDVMLPVHCMLRC